MNDTDTSDRSSTDGDETLPPDERPKIAQAKLILEILHGDYLRDAHASPEVDEVIIGKAEGLGEALAVIETVEDGNFDVALLAQTAEIEARREKSPDYSALVDLSRHEREGNPPTDHRLIARVAPVESRGYWQLLKQWLGFG